MESSNPAPVGIKNNIVLWALYDFANSLVLMSFLFYFSQWLVVDQGRPSWWYNATLIVSSLLFIITAPFFSARIDRNKAKLAGLRIWTFLSLILYACVAVLAMTAQHMDLLAAVGFTLATYTYLMSFLYFTPMLNDLSTRANRSWISGLGQGANSIGQVAGVLVTLPFVNGITLFGEPGRAQALLPGVILFALFAIPMLVLYREEISTVDTSIQARGDFISLFKTILSHRPLVFILLAYFLFSDALVTFANNFPLYLEFVHGVSDTTKSLLTAAILILAAFGSLIFGKIADKKGNIRVLRGLVITWCLLLIITAVASNFTFVVIIFLIGGLLFGPVWAISRSVVGQLAPDHLVASSYGYYVLAERFATFIGPAVWSLTLITVGEGARGYRAGLISLAMMLAISLFALKKIDRLSNKSL